MITYELGKTFPQPERQPPGRELSIAAVNGHFFDVLFYADDPPSDKNVFTRNAIRYGVFEQDDIPFFIVDMGGSFCLEVTININSVSNAHVETWLNSTSTTISLFLIDARTNILHGMRVISIAKLVAGKIRDCLERQDARYASVGQVNAAIDAIERRLTLAEMLSQTTMYRL